MKKDYKALTTKSKLYRFKLMIKMLNICVFAAFLFNGSILLSQNKIMVYLNSGITYNCYRGDNYSPPDPTGSITMREVDVNYAGGTKISIPDYSTGLKINYCFKDRFIVESGIMYMRRNYYFLKNIDTIIKYTPPSELYGGITQIHHTRFNNIEIPINVGLKILKSRIILKVGVNICPVSFQNYYTKDISSRESEYGKWEFFEKDEMFFPSASIEFPLKIKNFGFNAYFTYFEKFNKNYDINFGLNFKLFDIKST